MYDGITKYVFGEIIMVIRWKFFYEVEMNNKSKFFS